METTPLNHPFMDAVVCPLCGGFHEPDDCPERLGIEELVAAGEIYDSLLKEEDYEVLL